MDYGPSYQYNWEGGREGEYAGKKGEQMKKRLHINT